MCVPFLYGRAGHLRTENGGFRPGQCEAGLGVNYARTDLPDVVTVDYCEPVLAAPVVTQTSWQEEDGKITRTYALAVKLHAEYIRNVYGIYGVPGNPTVLPPAYHDVSGVDIGGVDPTVVGKAGLDAWVTVGPTGGGAEGTIESTGVDFSGWTAKAPLVIEDGLIYWSEPDNGPTPADGEVTIAQLTLGSMEQFEARVNLLGRSVGDRSLDEGSGLVKGDWEWTVDFNVDQRLAQDNKGCAAELADLNTDGQLGLDDIFEVLKAMSMTSCDLRPDVTGDCKVDTQDLLLVLGAVDQVSVRWRTTTCASF